MLNEQNVMDVLIGGSMLAGFIGLVAGSIAIADRNEIEMKKRRTAAQRGITNIGRKQAVLALSSEVIRKG